MVQGVDRRWDKRGHLTRGLGKFVNALRRRVSLVTDLGQHGAGQDEVRRFSQELETIQATKDEEGAGIRTDDHVRESP